MADDITEDSYLKDSVHESEKPKKPVVEIPKKIDRIRDKISSDYENEGFESYS